MLMIDEEDFDKICCHYCILNIEAVCDYKEKKIVCPTVNRMKEKAITFSDDDPFLAFAEAMRKKVSIKVQEYNRRKDPWNHEIEFLVDRFEEEIEEFFKPYRETGELKRDELVDIGNFAMFIWKLIEIEKLKRRGA